jgi:hypothetical protein
VSRKPPASRQNNNHQFTSQVSHCFSYSLRSLMLLPYTVSARRAYQTQILVLFLFLVIRRGSSSGGSGQNTTPIWHPKKRRGLRGADLCANAQAVTTVFHLLYSVVAWWRLANPSAVKRTALDLTYRDLNALQPCPSSIQALELTRWSPAYRPARGTMTW